MTEESTDLTDVETDAVELEPVVIIVATHNQHKIGEIGRTLVPLIGRPLELRPTSGKAPKEDGTTFEENALIKARAAFAETGLPSIATTLKLWPGSARLRISPALPLRT